MLRADFLPRTLFVLAFVVLYFTAREWGIPAWRLEWVAAVVVAAVAAVGSGYILARSRWQPIAAAVRAALAEGALVSVGENREPAAHRKWLTEPTSGSLPAKQRSVTRADLIYYSLAGLTFFMVYMVSRDVEPPTWHPWWVAVSVVACVVLFAVGYLLAHWRWRRIVVEAQHPGRPGAGDSSPPEGPGE